MATRFNRHIPRLCRSCDAPMARQEDTCWRCGAVWHDRPALTGGTAGDARSLARVDTDRWINEGGSVISEAPLRAPVMTISRG